MNTKASEAYRPSVVDFAYDILEMQSELSDLRRELHRLRNIEADYWKLLNESLAHGEKMMGGMLMLALNGNLRPAASLEEQSK